MRKIEFVSTPSVATTLVTVFHSTRFVEDSRTYVVVGSVVETLAKEVVEVELGAVAVVVVDVNLIPPEPRPKWAVKLRLAVIENDSGFCV